MYLFVPQGLAERGQAGDLYGSINALFSGLAFAGVIVTILLQREELILQRKELIQTREELARSAAAQDESQKALNKTIYAQSFKVAMDILEDPAVIEARRRVWVSLNQRRDDWREWTDDSKFNVSVVSRKFETVATMMRRGILPDDYILETWSVPIVRNWGIMEGYLKWLRIDRNDPFISVDFEWMADKAKDFLRSKGIARPEMMQ
jgi:hypothetical protein